MARKFAALSYVKNNVRIFMRKREQKKKELKSSIKSRIRILLRSS